MKVYLFESILEESFFSWLPRYLFESILVSFFSWIPRYRLRIASKENLAKGGQELHQELLERLIDCHLMKASGQVNFNRDPSRLPLRELPHGNWSNVYLLYVAYCKTRNEPVASKSTFFMVRKPWRAALRFHKRSQHQICETCSSLKSRIRNATESCL